MSETLSLWSSLFCFVSGAVFVTSYAVLARWYRSAMGRMLITQSAAITVLAGMTVLYYALGQDPTPIRYARSALIVTTGFALCYQTWALIRVQVKRKKES